VWLNSDAIPMFEEWIYDGRRVEWIKRHIRDEMYLWALGR
jgi:hypothetical protein